MKTKKSKAPQYVSSLIRLTADVAEVLKKSAEANHRSFAAEIRVAAELYAAGLKAKA
jgi:formiminotetrahydrofolate cyclodeaminase